MRGDSILHNLYSLSHHPFINDEGTGRCPGFHYVDDEFLYDDSHQNTELNLSKYERVQNNNCICQIDYNIISDLYPREVSTLVLLGFFCLQRFFCLVLLQAILTQSSFSIATGETRQFLKSGFLACFQNIAATVPCILDLLAHQPYFQKIRALFLNTLCNALYPISSSLGFNLMALICESPNTEVPTRKAYFRLLLSLECCFFLIPAFLEVLASWFSFLSLTALPWGIWLGLGYTSVIAQNLITAYVFSRPIRYNNRTGIGFMLIGCALFWINCTTFIQGVVPYNGSFDLSLSKSKHGTDEMLSHKGNIKQHSLLELQNNIPFICLGGRVVLQIVGQILRVLSVTLQETLFLSTNTNSDDAMKTHSVLVCGLSLLTIPFFSWIFWGNDYNQQLESLYDTLIMITKNRMIVFWCILYFCCTALTNITAFRLVKRVYTHHLTVLAIFETLTIFTAILLKCFIFDIHQVNYPILATVLGTLGYCFCFIGLLTVSHFLILGLPQNESDSHSIVLKANNGDFLQLRKPLYLCTSAIVVVQSAIVYLHGGSLLAAYDLSMSYEEYLESFQNASTKRQDWNTFHSTAVFEAFED